jgi:hypothetical protein
LQFSEANWGPVLKGYLDSIDNITDEKWQNILAGAQEFMESEADVIEIESSDESEVDGRGNILPSSPL